jgi:hypothetical protein
MADQTGKTRDQPRDSGRFGNKDRGSGPNLTLDSPSPGYDTGGIKVVPDIPVILKFEEAKWQTPHIRPVDYRNIDSYSGYDEDDAEWVGEVIVMNHPQYGPVAFLAKRQRLGSVSGTVVSPDGYVKGDVFSKDLIDERGAAVDGYRIGNIDSDSIAELRSQIDKDSGGYDPDDPYTPPQSPAATQKFWGMVMEGCDQQA